VNGIINSGRVKIGDSVLIGPDSLGGWATTTVKSMQRKRFVLLGWGLGCLINGALSAAVDHAEAGQCVSMALKRVRKSAVRKGMVVVGKTETPPVGARPQRRSWNASHDSTASKKFEAQVLIL
jgi:GTPase